MESAKTDYHDNVPPFHTYNLTKSDIWCTLYFYSATKIISEENIVPGLSLHNQEQREVNTACGFLSYAVCAGRVILYLHLRHMFGETAMKAQEIRHHCTCSLQSTNALLKLDSRLKPTEI